MPVIYRKTAKGQAEIETRAHHLSPRLRTPLIMVDGRRSDDDLRRLIAAQPEESLRALLEQGFIEVITDRRTDSANAAHAAVDPAPVPAPRAPTPAAMPATTPSAGGSPELPALQRLAVRRLNDALGPMAESIAMRIERCRSVPELVPLLHTARLLVEEAQGDEAGLDFARLFGLR